MNIRLCKMTKMLCRTYYQKFQMDPDVFDDMSKFQPYTYDSGKCDALVDRHQQLGRIYLAILCDNEPIGELILKNIDREAKCCTLSIHLQNDVVKNRGYGTRAEIMALQYAFDELDMEVVYADAIHKNKRSQHVLEKAGFSKTHNDDRFVYYCCEKRSWGLNSP